MCCGLCACETADNQDARPVAKQTQRTTHGVVVARVNGDAVTLSEVEELSLATKLAPTEALRRLEEERVLAEYAQGKGYGADAQSARELKKARVRALLKTAVEQGTAPEDISATEVATRFEALRQRDEKPQMRGITHVLFKTKDAASEAKARSEAEVLLREAKAKTSSAEQQSTLSTVPEKGVYHGVQVVRESFEARADTLEAPFAEAAFALAEPGIVPRVVRTSYGFHVIVVRDIKPPYRLVLADQEPGIRKQVSLEKRQAALAKLLEELKLKDPYKLDEAFVRKALADDRLLGSAP